MEMEMALALIALQKPLGGCCANKAVGWSAILHIAINIEFNEFVRYPMCVRASSLFDLFFLPCYYITNVHLYFRDFDRHMLWIIRK